jgi:hypothetical protein
VLIYSGTATSIIHNGGTGTKYYRVRACNGNGCSGYSNIVWKDWEDCSTTGY